MPKNIITEVTYRRSPLNAEDIIGEILEMSTLKHCRMDEAASCDFASCIFDDPAVPEQHLAKKCKRHQIIITINTLND